MKTETKNNKKAAANFMKFTGEYLDPTGLYHLRARQYDSTLGRFTSTDPWSPAKTDPYVSAYAYVGNRPSVFVDPSGLIASGPESAPNGPSTGPISMPEKVGSHVCVDYCRDWGTLAAGAVNIPWGLKKYLKGYGELAGGAIFAAGGVGGPAIAKGLWDIPTGASKVGRGAAQVWLGLEPGTTECSTQRIVVNFGKGIAPDFSGSWIEDIGTLPV